MQGIFAVAVVLTLVAQQLLLVLAAECPTATKRASEYTPLATADRRLLKPLQPVADTLPSMVDTPEAC
jgi:hypothetical protein